MKKQNTLRALSALTVSLVLAVFLTTCEDGGYEPTVRGIRFEYNPLEVEQNIPDELMVICDIPSSIKEITLKFDYLPSLIKITDDDYSFHDEPNYFNYPPFVTEPIPRDYDIRYDDDDKYDGTYLPFSVTAKGSVGTSAIITVTAEPGGVSATCTVTVIPPSP
jgi:hypothetical protein